MPSNVLITGGTGLIGTRITQLLVQQGYTVSYFSRRSDGDLTASHPQVRMYSWNIPKGELDTEALLQADFLIHLAGAGIADERWTKSRKREIIDSRTQSIQLIAEHLKSVDHKIQAFVSASGISIYGVNTGQRILTEDTRLGSDFLADVTKRWEAAADTVAQLSIRTVKLRTGIVLSQKGGALAKIAQPIRLGAGAPLGSGKQIMSWIHLDDLANLFIYALENPAMSGVYNAVAPNPITNEKLTQLAAEVLHKPLWLPHVPAFALRLAFGEMADIVLGGNYVLNKRIAQETTFRYQFTDARQALENLLAP